MLVDWLDLPQLFEVTIGNNSLNYVDKFVYSSIVSDNVLVINLPNMSTFTTLGRSFHYLMSLTLSSFINGY